jgi:sigma-E factor negative regulatory protein RseB
VTGAPVVRWLFAGAVLVLVLGPATPVTADAMGSDAVSADEAAALEVLERAVTAPARTAYSGVAVVAVWDMGAVSRTRLDVDHVPGLGTSVRVRPGGAHPAGLGAQLPAGPAAAGAADAGPLHLLARSYDLLVASAATVAGRRAKVVEVRRLGGAVAARLWVDESTGLLLRRELYDPAGATTRASAFERVRIGATRALPGGGTVLRPMDRAVLPPDAAVLRGAGWVCPDGGLGGLSLVAAGRMATSYGEVLHLVYSDGVMSVSVFEQRGRLDPASLRGWQAQRWGSALVHVRPGTPRQLVWSGAGSVFTVVADAPAATVAAVVVALPHDTEQPRQGMLSRMGRGADRVASWFTPFS